MASRLPRGPRLLRMSEMLELLLKSWMPQERLERYKQAPIGSSRFGLGFGLEIDETRFKTDGKQLKTASFRWKMGGVRPPKA